MKVLSVEEFNAHADYAAWAGHGLQETAAGMTVDQVQSIRDRIIEGDYVTDFRAQYAFKDPNFRMSDFLFISKPATSDPVVSTGDLEMLDAAQRESKYQLDLLTLASESAKVLHWLAQRRDSEKNRQLAQAAHIRSQIHSGRNLVVEPSNMSLG